jgi:hypothetical protein
MRVLALNKALNADYKHSCAVGSFSGHADGRNGPQSCSSRQKLGPSMAYGPKSRSAMAVRSNRLRSIYHDSAVVATRSGQIKSTHQRGLRRRQTNCSTHTSQRQIAGKKLFAHPSACRLACTSGLTTLCTILGLVWLPCCRC